MGIALVLAALTGTTGCSKSQPPKQEGAASPPAASSAEPPAAEPRVGGEVEESERHAPGATDAAIVPGATGAEIWKQIAAEQGKLEAAIQAGELARVEGLAFRIRDLVVALGEKTTGLGGTDLEKLQDIVVRLRVSASELAEEGEEGAASGVKEEYAQFKDLLAQLQPLTGAH